MAKCPGSLFRAIRPPLPLNASGTLVQSQGRARRLILIRAWPLDMEGGGLGVSDDKEITYFTSELLKYILLHFL